jgi:twitching motility protein PilI
MLSFLEGLCVRKNRKKYTQTNSLKTLHFSLKTMLPSEALNRPLTRKADDNVQTTFSDQTITRRLGFKMGNLGLLIAQQATSELTDISQNCPIPFTASWLLGLINLRGNLIPVFDLHKLLQLQRPEQKKPMLLILGQGETAGAIVIEDLPIHLSFTDSDKLKSLPPLPAMIKSYASSGYEKNGQLWFNFDHKGFFESLATKVAL